MNDAHDNAADDKAMLRQVHTDRAVEAFRRVELKRIQLEAAEYRLEMMVANGLTDTERYAEATEQIRRQSELRRADYARLGMLPRQERDINMQPGSRRDRAAQARRTPRDAPLG